ncbi:MAG: sucrase ferredoxin [Cyanobacteria bacterium J06632_22]
MEPFLCAVASQAAQEDLIGTASPCDTFIFIECPEPWASKAFESTGIPETLRNFVQQLASKNRRFFLITAPRSRKTVRILIYQKHVGTFAGGYDGRELQVDSLEQSEVALQNYFQGKLSGKPIISHDIFVCVHGSRDKCCARFGRPFFHHALKQLDLASPSVPVRLWQVSHIGGHRFAPTAIHLPEGRFYGRLDTIAFQALLGRIQLRSGSDGILNCDSLDALIRTYRGWSLLPTPLQSLERDLLAASSGQWFFNQVAYKILGPSQDPGTATTLTKARLSVLSPNNLESTYEAHILKRPDQQLRLSCEAASPANSYQYRVTYCRPVAAVPTALACAS